MLPANRANRVSAVTQKNEVRADGREESEERVGCLALLVQVKDRWALVRSLMQHGRGVAVQHTTSAQEILAFLAIPGECPVAGEVPDPSMVLLPTYPAYGRTEVGASIACIRS